MSNPTEQTYDLNTKELIEAAKAMLQVVENINQVSMSIQQLTLAWGRLNKAVETMEYQEQDDGTNSPKL